MYLSKTVTGWAWSRWSSSGEGTFSRRVTLTGYDTDVPCVYVETKYIDLSQGENVLHPQNSLTDTMANPHQSM